MKNGLLVTITTVLILMFLLELFFRFVIVSAEKPIAVFDEKEALLRSDPNNRSSGIYTIGKLGEIKAKWRTNNFGWNSSIDYSTERDEKKKLICIIGDSYIRALQVDVNSNISALLREKLKNDKYQVYSFGHDGAPLSQYLHMSRYVNKYFNPDIIVFLLVHNDFNESISNLVSKPYFLQINISNEKISEVYPQKVRLYQFLTYSSIFRYLYSNLHLAQFWFTFKEKPKINANVDVVSTSNNKNLIAQGTKYLIKKIKTENSNRRVIFLMDAPRYDIYQTNIKESNVIWINNMVKEITESLGIEYIDLTDFFKEDFLKNGKKFEFSMDGHWNGYGHYIASKVLLNAIISEKQVK